MSKKEVATKENGALAVMDFAQDANAGMEEADKASYAIPFFTVLQGLSPQCQPPKDGGVEGARQGLFINTITNELFEELLVIPCAFNRRFLQWAPRNSGGGFRGEHMPSDVETGRLNGAVLVDGTYFMNPEEGKPVRDDQGAPLYDHLADTRNHFVLAKNSAGSWVQGLISLGSSQIKKSKRWMSRINGIEMQDANGKKFTPPSFSHIYKLTSGKEENSKGSWYGVNVDLIGPVEDAETYEAAKAFWNAVKEGAVEVSQPVDEESSSKAESF